MSTEIKVTPGKLAPSEVAQRVLTLMQQGKAAQAIQCLRDEIQHRPNITALKLQLIHCLITAGNLQLAEAEAAALADNATAAEAWRLISRAYVAMQQWSVAQNAIESALRFQPSSRELRFDRALLLDHLGSSNESLAELESLAREALDSPELVSYLARALHFAERTDEAEALLESGIRRWPTHVQLHTALTRLRWLRGAGEAATAALERAIVEHPSELQLRLVAANLLRNGGFLHKALTLVQGGLKLSPNSVAFMTSVGVLLDSLDRPGDALVYLRAAVSGAGNSAQIKRNLIPTLLRVGEPAEALAACKELEAQAPHDQQLIAYRAMALRMVGDAQYQTLHDYTRLVRSYQPPPPTGFNSVKDFNVALATRLLQLHQSDQRPLDQSLRGGTQTDRDLPRTDPVIAKFFAMIDEPIKNYISLLNESVDHPTDRRKCLSYRIAGSWSVQLKPDGFHVNHVHPMGWLSSAYYIELPADSGDDSNRSGWLKFGEPSAATPGCTPDYFVKPQEGMLVLFPSYMWHGTVPFTTGSRRLTAAFDVVPA